MAWRLHGAISHNAIRRHLDKASMHVPEENVVSRHVRMFLAGLKPMVATHGALQD